MESHIIEFGFLFLLDVIFFHDADENSRKNGTFLEPSARLINWLQFQWLWRGGNIADLSLITISMGSFPPLRLTKFFSWLTGKNRGRYGNSIVVATNWKVECYQIHLRLVAEIPDFALIHLPSVSTNAFEWCLNLWPFSLCCCNNAFKLLACWKQRNLWYPKSVFPGHHHSGLALEWIISHLLCRKNCVFPTITATFFPKNGNETKVVVTLRNSDGR